MASPSQIAVSDFSEIILDKTVFFKVMRLTDSFFVWVGLEPHLSNMAVAMPAKYGSVPSCSLLFGNKSDLSSTSLAQKLAKKLSKQVFVSCTVPFDQHLSVLVEKRLAQELALNGSGDL
ncbi:proteasome assembly chaperone 4 isoform X2 [Aplysia californica]|uniref:Proteasome assembly chaperone 4 isoform X2 n=1 Tax=Aplysia californica TaxID=6500 RepID=A0ABM0JK79_APLCA|nr:proteasome assembly chaperone 4 isoform X2 [Aplysia californica]